MTGVICRLEKGRKIPRYFGHSFPKCRSRTLSDCLYGVTIFPLFNKVWVSWDRPWSCPLYIAHNTGLTILLWKCTTRGFVCRFLLSMTIEPQAVEDSAGQTHKHFYFIFRYSLYKEVHFILSLVLTEILKDNELFLAIDLWTVIPGIFKIWGWYSRWHHFLIFICWTCSFGLIPRARRLTWNG